MSGWLSWLILSCVVLAVIMMVRLYAYDHTALKERRDQDRNGGAAATSDADLAISVGRDGTATGRWIDWLSATAAALLIGAAVFFNKCDFAKQIATKPLPDGPVAVQATLNTDAVDKVAKKVEAAAEKTVDAAKDAAKDVAATAAQTVEDVKQAAATATAKIEDKIKDAAPAEEPVGSPEAQVEQNAASTPEAPTEAAAETVEAAAPEAPSEPVPAQSGAGVTQYYGESDSTKIMAWSAEASLNPDYAAVAEAAAEDQPASENAAAPDVAEAPAQPEPAAEVVHGVTQFYGIAEKPDADMPWAAAATVYDVADVQTAEQEAAPTSAPAAAPEAPANKTEPGITQFYGYADENAEPPAWAEEAEMNPDYERAAEAEETAPKEDSEPAAAAEAPSEYKTEPGITQYYGSAEKPDSEMPWSAPATVYVTEMETAPATPEAAPAEAASPTKTEPGVTQFYGTAEKPDAEMPWSAPATVYAQETPPAAEPAKQEAVEACRDSLNAEVKTGVLNFYTSSWEIDSDSWPTLDKIARTAKDCSAGFVIEVAGHTDNTGKPASNQTLSELRAAAVVKYLIKAGVPESKLKAVGYGQDKPVSDNDTAAGRRQNRRIEFSVSGG